MYKYLSIKRVSTALSQEKEVTIIQNRTEQKVYFHINTLFTSICDRVIIDS